MTEFRFDEQKTTSLRHKITDDIRRAIFQGKIKPGDRIREVDMAKQMGISRGPIREAMRTLEQEGILNSQPYKETMVAEISAEEVLEILIPIRLTIELFAIRKALPNIDSEKIEKLAGIIAEMKEASAQKNLYKIVDCDLLFHEYLVSLSDMPNLIGTWSSIFNRIRLHFIMQGQTYEELNILWKTHEKLLETIKEGDLAAISAELTSHIKDSNLGFLKTHV
ncbi:GntR family transcriptional regulator [Paenibacillus baekrokdamisoli]|uniref:GntR family transcriptional regulator n=1 Tax=Paenibacillus baekrokdamisoli TaxID=1712516 RepID=A0A3G9J157_9BACL|nr:GntR family transcriptional regulator [Paenibacillus baekrokdamisoli]MBB3070956.1 DNA-binding GntR family transcriptional regulator [Paenibacillus baekrokdamisoli]BBH22105.1 GntR family transcriptional regulator [Paenibacillus baekrokdamisoli]